MRVLVVGSGGREHALCWKLSQTATAFCTPGNPGIAACATLVEEVSADYDLVVIGPERPLIAGLADELRAAGAAVYGPSAYCARIEGSKEFSKTLMREEGVPTAAFRSFTDFDSARAYISGPVVVKASGEALGKGVVVASSAEEAVEAARRMLVEGEFGEAGRTIVVEERLSGPEMSLIAICSGTQYRLLPSSRDYKSAYDHGQGPNTGGMGVVSPARDIDIEPLGRAFIQPILERFARDGQPYVGALYCGLMLTPDGPKALEYNARFGDPETQALLPRLRGDFAQLLLAAAKGQPLPQIEVSDDVCVTVVIAAKGYPGEYLKGLPIPSLPEGIIVFHAGTKMDGGRLVSSGGRVLNLTATAPTVEEARAKVYAAAAHFSPDMWHYRHDIGT